MKNNLLVYAQDAAKLPQLVQAGAKLKQQLQLEEMVLLVAGPEADSAALNVANSGVDLVVAVSADNPFSETVGAIVEQMAVKYQAKLVLMHHLPFETEVAARAGTRLKGSCVANCLSVSVSENGQLVVTRLLYGGVVTGEYHLTALPAVLTLNEAACRESSAEAAGTAPIIKETVQLKISKKKVLERKPIEKSVDLKGAQKIVSIGRGLSKQEDLPMIEELAEALQAQVGCSRPLVEDYKWMKLERQVGLTGTTVSPKLYVAIGISGQIQHVVGMKDAGVVVAINNNKNAPIFSVADYGIVGDLYEIVPKLKEKTRLLQAKS